MKIVVCIKQVPDTKGGVKFNPDGTLDRAAMLAIMNPDDKAGLEAALRIKRSDTVQKLPFLPWVFQRQMTYLREAYGYGRRQCDPCYRQSTWWSRYMGYIYNHCRCT